MKTAFMKTAFIKKTDVLIIGSGISSLICAILLSKKGKSVCVLEQYKKPGGYLHCFSREGFRFDSGAHYIGAMGKSQPFRVLLEHLGVYDEKHFTELDPDGFDVLVFPGFTYSFPVGYEQNIERLSGMFPTESRAIRDYFSLIQKTVKLFPTYEYHDETNSMALLEATETPLMKVISDHTSDPRLQAVLCAICALHGVFPKDVSFGFHAIVMDSLIRGPVGFSDGGGKLAQALVSKIEQQGGEVHLNKKVTRIESEGKVARAVLTADGERFEAEWIISGIHPKNTFQLLSDDQALSPAFKQRLSTLEETESIFGVYGICDAQAEINPRKNYYFFGAEDPDGLFLIRTPEDLPQTVCLLPSDREAGSQQPLPVSLHAASPMRWFEPWRNTQHKGRPPEYRAAKERYAQRMIDAINQRRPGFSSHFKCLDTSSPLTNLHYNGSPDGAAYGLYHSIKNTGARAIGPRTHLGNLLLTGQNTLFPGLLGAAIASLRTSGHILGVKALLRELKERGQQP